MKDLIGMECNCVFALPANEWPIEGYPAWVQVLAVDMPMVKLCGVYQEHHAQWVNCSTIKTIRAVGPLRSSAKPRSWLQKFFAHPIVSHYRLRRFDR